MIKVSGKIKQIFDTEIFGTFEKRVMWLDEISDKFPNTYQFELWQTDCPMADNYKVGDYVTCYLDLKGKYWNRNDKEGVMNTLKCWNIEKDGKSFKEIKL